MKKKKQTTREILKLVAVLALCGVFFYLLYALILTDSRIRGRSITGWFLFCATLPLALIILCNLPPLRETQGRYRHCDDCGTLIPWEHQHCFECDLTRQANKELHGAEDAYLDEEDESSPSP